MNFDWHYFFSLFTQLPAYIPITILMAVLSMALAIFIGGFITSLQLSPVAPFRGFAHLYISLFRGMRHLFSSSSFSTDYRKSFLHYAGYRLSSLW